LGLFSKKRKEKRKKKKKGHTGISMGLFFFFPPFPTPMGAKAMLVVEQV
jgi:hypothetical protein